MRCRIHLTYYIYILQSHTHTARAACRIIVFRKIGFTKDSRHIIYIVYIFRLHIKEPAQHNKYLSADVFERVSFYIHV